jgi:catechol 2,3-dioxygenase-like lactoylglutathione lyase family enzyme
LPRALDHIVIPSRDLEAQADLFRRLGFQVGARNRHPWGTENHIIQFDGAFLELISLGEGFVAPEPAPKEFSFAGAVAKFLQRREGMAMLVMRSDDAEADRREFVRSGLGDFSRFYFGREGRRPNGEVVTVAFSLAFAASAAFPSTAFFVCQQHYPENFWSRAAQVHPNGALGVAGVRLEHPRPDEGVDFLGKFFAAIADRKGAGYVFGLEDGVVAELREGPAPSLTRLQIRVADIRAAERKLAAGGVAFAKRDGRLEVSARDAMGVEIGFVEA